MGYGDNYKPNKESKSNEDSKSSKKQFEAVVNNPAKVKKKSEIKKATSGLFNDDISGVFVYIFKEVIMPSAKKLLYDMVTKGLDAYLYPDGSNRSERGSNRVSYNNYYKERDRASRPTSEYRSRHRTGLDYAELILDTRGEADKVKTAMIECAYRYGIVSIASMYEFAKRYDLIDDNYILHNYGWTLEAVSRISVVPVEEGYWLKTPKAMPIDDMD